MNKKRTDDFSAIGLWVRIGLVGPKVVVCSAQTRLALSRLTLQQGKHTLRGAVGNRELRCACLLEDLSTSEVGGF